MIPPSIVLIIIPLYLLIVFRFILSFGVEYSQRGKYVALAFAICAPILSFLFFRKNKVCPVLRILSMGLSSIAFILAIIAFTETQASTFVFSFIMKYLIPYVSNKWEAVAFALAIAFLALVQQFVYWYYSKYLSFYDIMKDYYRIKEPILVAFVYLSYWLVPVMGFRGIWAILLLAITVLAIVLIINGLELLYLDYLACAPMAFLLVLFVLIGFFKINDHSLMVFVFSPYYNEKKLFPYLLVASIIPLLLQSVFCEFEAYSSTVGRAKELINKYGLSPEEKKLQEEQKKRDEKTSNVLWGIAEVIGVIIAVVVPLGGIVFLLHSCMTCTL